MEDNQIDIEKSLCFGLYSASRLMTQLYRKYLDPLGITYPQYVVVSVLSNAGTCSVLDLSQKLLLDSSTLTPLLKRLEFRGYISRTRSKDDERVLNVELSVEGKKLIEDLKKVPLVMFCDINLSMEKLISLNQQVEELKLQLLKALD